MRKPSLDIIPAPSPYFDNRDIKPTFIVIHCTGYDDPLTVLYDNKVSAHYLIPVQNDTSTLTAYELVQVYPMPLRAWHAGLSYWLKYVGLNDYAIGIEVSMPDYAHALEVNTTLNFMYFQAYQSLQMTALKILVTQLQEHFSIPSKNVLGHSDIAAWRNISGTVQLGKTDPGPTLPWSEFGVWPEGDCPNEVANDLTPLAAQRRLSEVGYFLPSTGVFDNATNLTVGAARMRWNPSCFNLSSGLATACYQRPFDSELACSLYRLGRSTAPAANFPAWAIAVSVISPLCLLTMIVLFCKYCRSDPRKGYANVGGSSSLAKASIPIAEEGANDAAPAGYQPH